MSVKVYQSYYVSFQRLISFNAHFMWHVTLALRIWTCAHFDQLFNVKVQSTSWRESSGNLDGSRQVVFEPGTIWCLAFPWQELCLSLRWALNLSPIRYTEGCRSGGWQCHRSPDCHPVSYAARYPASCLNEHPELSLCSSRPRIHFTLFIYSLSLMFP